MRGLSADPDEWAGGLQIRRSGSAGHPGQAVDTNSDTDRIDWLLHQANQRILDAVAERFAIPTSKVLSNLANYGTPAATIPLMLDEAVRDGRISRGIASSAAASGPV